MRTALILFAMSLFTLNAFAVEVADGWILRQITNSEYIGFPGDGINSSKISGTTIVWPEYVNGGPAQIMLWDGINITQISNGTNFCTEPDISGGNVIWKEYVSGKWQVMFWDGSTVSQISSGTNYCYEARISGTHVVWTESSDKWGTRVVMFWDGSTSAQISSSTESCFGPDISGSNVVWYEAMDMGSSGKILFWNGSMPTQISTTMDAQKPQISGSNVTWLETLNDMVTAASSRVMFWSGSTPTQISGDNVFQNYSSSSISISGSNVVWTEALYPYGLYMGHDAYKVIHWDGVSQEGLDTHVNKYIFSPVVSGSNIVWGSTRSIFYSDGNDPVKVVDFGLSSTLGNYDISDTNITFMSLDENNECQVYLLQPGASSPAPITQMKSSDINEDHVVDLVDLSILASEWLGESSVQITNFSLNMNPLWTAEGIWEYGRPQGSGGVSYGNSDPITGSTGTSVYGMNLNGDYTTATGGPYYLTTSPIDCSHFNNVALNFAQWLNVDAGDKVLCTVEISNNGSTWTTVWTNPAGMPVTDNQWQQVQYNISSLADGQSAVSIRWGYEVIDSGAQAYSGWNIDDIQLWGESNQ